MLTTIKNAYCFYLIQLAINCHNDYELNLTLDKIIDQDMIEKSIDGDKDIKEVFQYVCEYRRYNRCLREQKPFITGKVVLKAVAKSII